MKLYSSLPVSPQLGYAGGSEGKPDPGCNTPRLSTKFLFDGSPIAYHQPPESIRLPTAISPNASL